MITLFTFNRAAWKIRPIDALRRYGNEDEHGRLGLYQSLTTDPNSRGLYLALDNESLAVTSDIDATILVKWKLEDVTSRFIRKLSNLLLVKAKVEERGGFEYFNYHRAILLSGSPDKDLLKQKLLQGKVIVDLRLHDIGTEGARNHGTAFRVLANSLEEVYETRRDRDLKRTSSRDFEILP